MLKPSLAILDETDSGLDVDAVRTVSKGVCEYQKDKDSVFVYSANSGAKVNDRGAMVSAPNPTLMEFKWNASKPSLEIQLENCAGYQAMPISVNAAFAPAK